MKARRREAILAQRVEDGEYQRHHDKPDMNSDISCERIDDKKRKVISMLKRKRVNDNEI